MHTVRDALSREIQIFSPDSNDRPARNNLMHKKFCIKFGKFDAWIWCKVLHQIFGLIPYLLVIVVPLAINYTSVNRSIRGNSPAVKISPTMDEDAFTGGRAILKTLYSTWNWRVRRVYSSMRGSVKTKGNEWSWVEDAPCWPCWPCWCRSRNTGTNMKQLLVHRVLTSVASASVHDFLHEDHTKSTRQRFFGSSARCFESNHYGCQILLFTNWGQIMTSEFLLLY